MTQLAIHETFQQTIQGEGYWTGTPVDFIRLAGCPVGCPWCDTGYADGGKGLPRIVRSIPDLLAELKTPRVVISGGEPFLQPELATLVTALLKDDRTVSIETSGAIWREIDDRAWITLSPKHHVSPRYPVQPEFWPRANEVKLVIAQAEDLMFYNQALEQVDAPIFLQAEWDAPASLPLVLDLLKRHPQYRLSTQLHKYLGVQ
jgi:7-carboxy-7-deazaguanine synthase